MMRPLLQDPDEHIAIQEYLDCIDHPMEFVWSW